MLRIKLLLVLLALTLLNIKPRGAFFAAIGFISAVLMTVLILHKPSPPPVPPLEPALAAKADRLATHMEAREIRVIPIVRQVPIATPVTRVAAADPIAELPHVETAPGANKQPEDVTEAPAPRVHRHYGDICAAHGMHKIERGRGWRCVHARR